MPLTPASDRSAAHPSAGLQRKEPSADHYASLKEMEDLLEKTAEQIKDRIEFWFTKYHNKAKTEFNGSEPFTLFDQIPLSRQQELLSQVHLKTQELAVLILIINQQEFILNTTERFIRIKDTHTESLAYTDFGWHAGFQSFVLERPVNGRPVNVKMTGYISPFGLRMRDGQIIYWNIPTGEPGYGFWNVSKKCELIGRRFILVK